MKILLSWLNEFIDTKNYNIEYLTDKLTQIGLEVEDVQQINNINENLSNLVIGEVIECIKHPNADRLYCTKVKIKDSEEPLNIVCGAPNVRQGLKVVVAKVGSTLKTYAGEQLKIKKSKIRGEISEGMLCAEDEIGINNNHTSIIELDQNYTLDTDIKDIFKSNIQSDYIIDVDLTPNLSYANSYYGTAKDLSAALLSGNIKKTYSSTITLPKLNNNTINIKIDNNICSRYTCLLIKNVKISESPDIVKQRLTNIGIKPINNVVDISNYLMIEYGHPLHVYDFNNTGNNIIVKKSTGTFQALNKKTYDLNGDITICNNENILSLAVIIGGDSSAVTNNTTDILVECANFNYIDIKKTSSRLNIQTEASTRFTKDIDNTNNLDILRTFCELLKQQQTDIQIEGYEDIINLNHDNKTIVTTFDHINNIIGQNIPESTIINILKHLDINTQIEKDQITATIPNYRKNIECENDLIHEILRFYGYDNLDTDSLGSHLLFNNAPNKKHTIIENTFRNILCSNGLYEIRTNSLIDGSKIISNNNEIKLKNSSSKYHNTLRTNLIYSGLQVINYNINRNNNNLKLFEFGNIYFKKDNELIEEKHLGIFISGFEYTTWSKTPDEYNFFTIKNYTFLLLNSYNITNIILKPTDQNNEILTGVEIYHNDKLIGYIGKIKHTLLEQYDVKNDVFYSDLFFYSLEEIINSQKVTQFDELSKYQTVKRDLSLVIDANILYEEIVKTIKSVDNRIIDVNLFNIYNDNSAGNKKTYSISIYINDKTKNLDGYTLTNIFNNIIDTCIKKLNAEIKGIK